MKMGIRLIPNASRNEVAGRIEDGRFKVKVQSPPVEGAANKQLIVFLAGFLRVSKSRVRIISGEKSRDKVIEIVGDEAEILRRMEGKK
ncbi:MAG: DUF167 domain-containing protein [Candidatus Latescibacterota bacterium]